MTPAWRAAHHEWLGDEHAAGHRQGQQAQPLLTPRGAEPAPGDTASGPPSVPSGPVTPGGSRAVGQARQVGVLSCCPEGMPGTPKLLRGERKESPPRTEKPRWDRGRTGGDHRRDSREPHGRRALSRCGDPGRQEGGARAETARAVCGSPGTQGFPCAAAGAIQRPEDVRALAAHLYPRHAVPKPQATATTPQTAHAAVPGQDRGARGHRPVVGPSSLAPGAGEKQADACVLPGLVADSRGRDGRVSG